LQEQGDTSSPQRRALPSFVLRRERGERERVARARARSARESDESYLVSRHTSGVAREATVRVWGGKERGKHRLDASKVWSLSGSTNTKVWRWA